MATNIARPRRGLRLFLLVVALGGLTALAVVGWRWQAALPVEAVTVSGAVHADTSVVLGLIAVPDSARLFALDPDLLEDRVRRHPWVEDARVTRWATGTLAIDIVERTPAAVVLAADGRPAFYLDASAHMMPPAPASRASAYDVPILHGDFGDFQPTQPVADDAVRGLVAALAALPPAVDALVSSVERTPEGFVVWTAPVEGRSIPVALGRGDVAEKLTRLRAFWDQAVLTRPDTDVRRIDLRFASQIITEESG